MLRPLRFQVQNQPFMMLPVEGGMFDMGSDRTIDSDSFGFEQPVHSLRVPTFYLGQYSVTQALWAAVMSREDWNAYFPGDQRPMERVSWDGAQLFLKKIHTATDLPFRLPSEAEWEYAARGGVFNSGLKYAGSQRLKEVGWYADNSHGETKPVGCKFPNELGLYDMSGNVFEWVEDQWHANYLNAPKNGSAWLDAERNLRRIGRGGSFLETAQLCRSAFRSSWNTPDRNRYLGLRLALSLQ